ncbi:alpha/beta fold hydrolase [Pseudomonas sp. Z3-6]|uniref:alpha/beta fold hydrolase n=1 Tax=Pseudomonas sp. Z3-6 TaxID=2817411 RepID=UPI003DA94B70
MNRETMKSVHTAVGRVSFYVSNGHRWHATALLWPSLFTSGHASWEPQLATLHALGYRTILIDPPGHGASGLPPPRFSLRQCSEAALQILDNEGVQRAAFLGISWGGFVALQTAIIAPDRVSSMVLSNTSASRTSAMIRLRDGVVSQLIRIGFPQRFGLSGSLGEMAIVNLLGDRKRREDPEFASRLAQEINDLNKVALSRAVTSVLVKREDLLRHLHLIRIPTLVVAGACDQALPPAKHAALIANEIVGAKYELIPEVAHLAPREAPWEFASLLKSFLASEPVLDREAMLW